ncbi:peptidase inhibitor family I36 protein [Streptomyces zhihengii]
MPWARVATGDGGARVHSRCPSGYVGIYPEINFGGQPWIRRASDGSVTDLPSASPDRGRPIRNNSDRTARVYENATTPAAGSASPAAAAPSTTMSRWRHSLRCVSPYEGAWRVKRTVRSGSGRGSSQDPVPG